MLATVAGWIAPAATMIAAMMTAANLGARVTGWGFVVFSIGAVAWIIDALASGQTNLLLTNSFLLVVDVVGIWRWLGRQARYDAGSHTASVESAHADAPTLFPVSKIEGRSVEGRDGTEIGTAIEAMAACGDGRISYLVVRTGGVGGIGETLHALGWGEVRIEDEVVRTDLPAGSLGRRPALDVECWPSSAAAAGVA